MEILNSIHFLRPWWFLALLPIGWIIWRAWQVNRKQGAWHEIIDPKFRTLLLGEDASTEPSLNEKIGYTGLAVAWFLAILALSGPWVKSIDVPAQKSQQGVVIVLDLSLSMLADDLAPNRLSRVKYKLTDLLKQHPEYATGMVAYAGSAHTISPISEDNQTLLNLLPSLSPVMMPNYGANPLLGFKQAAKLLTGSNITQGHILWVTDDIESQEIDLIADWVSSHSVSMTVMTVGTDAGGVVQIPNYGLLKDSNDKLIMPKLPLQRFQQLSQKSNIKWVSLVPGEDSVAELLPPELASTNAQMDSEVQKEVNHPLDIGSYFLFLLIPLVAFIFRRGTLLSLMVVLILPATLFTPQPSYAEDGLSDFSAVFKSHDQQGYQAWEAKKYQAAEALFENPQWRASALYRQGRYAEAAKLFNLDKSPQGHYNRGNALALSGSLQGAHDAYEKALQLDPNFKEAQENLAVIKNLLAQQPENNSDSQDNAQNDNQEDKTGNSAQNSESSETQNEQESSSSADSKQPNSQQNNGQESASQPQKSGTDKQNGLDSENVSTSNQTGSQNQETDSNSTNDSATANGNADSSNTETSGTNNDLNQQGIAEDSQPGSSASSENDNQNSEENAVPSKLSDGTEQNTNDSQANGGYGNLKKPKLSEEEQAKQNWLKQIPDQPGLFLKRKFEYQFQQNPRSDNQTEKQW
ncbi:MAG: VWA domain-containing protein [Pseudomonadota bacterium]|nr:VWA domain-containing protein [Pseudomonadota bacterium]